MKAARPAEASVERHSSRREMMAVVEAVSCVAGDRQLSQLEPVRANWIESQPIQLSSSRLSMRGALIAIPRRRPYHSAVLWRDLIICVVIIATHPRIKGRVTDRLLGPRGWELNSTAPTPTGAR